MFPTDYPSILSRVEHVDPIQYGKTRNFIDGAVTLLSPYISRGVISTRQVMMSVLERGYDPYHIEKFLQELAWRDYWQQVWIAKGDQINENLKRPQPEVSNWEMPAAILDANTGIDAIDEAIESFYQSGYLHNHVRMYIAAICCNMGKSHWKIPAKWMYYHLMDGDWASNALSWQWVSGSNANKQYVANQENINKYCYTNQKGTFLDVPYDAFQDFDIPEELKETTIPELKTNLPETPEIIVDSSLPSLIYNNYNMDPNWRKDESANRILLLEPEVFEQYPISDASIQFLLDLGKNIENLQVFVGSFEELTSQYEIGATFYKEHPLNAHYEGTEEPRDWMFSVTGYYSSFFAFWKKCKKELKQYQG